MNSVNRPARLLRRALSALALTTAVPAFAQTAPAPSPTAGAPAAKAADQPVLLNPFEVSTQRDTSYGALNSNTISAFNMGRPDGVSP